MHDKFCTYRTDQAIMSDIIVSPCICHIITNVRADEREKLEKYYLNPCCFCGPDSWSTYVCDECIAENNKEVEQDDNTN